jgi:hypothetical protein
MLMIRGDSLWISTNRNNNNNNNHHNNMSAHHCYIIRRLRPWLSFLQAARGV